MAKEIGYFHTSSVSDGDRFTVTDVRGRTLKRMWVLAWIHPNGYMAAVIGNLNF